LKCFHRVGLEIKSQKARERLDMFAGKRRREISDCGGNFRRRMGGKNSA
jgi:hypothetical protein